VKKDVFTPHLFQQLLPTNEAQSGAHICVLLDQLQHHIQGFSSAVSLFDELVARVMAARRKRSESDFAKEEFSRIMGWPHIVARDAAMTAYHFGRTRDGIHETLGQCASLRPKLIGLRVASKQFEEMFPNYVQIRNAISHAAEVMKTPAAVERHSITVSSENPVPGFHAANGGSFQLVQQNTLCERTFVTTWEGQRYQCEIGAATLDKMMSVRDGYYAAFSAVDAEAERELRSRLVPRSE
jgi:hypothetical protein